MRSDSMDMAGIVGEVGREDQSRVRMIAMSDQAEDEPRPVTSSDKVTLGVTARKRRRGKTPERWNGRPAFEHDLRDDIDRDTGRPTLKELTFYRKVDLYTETVTVKATAEVIVKKVYRLSEKEAIAKAFRHYRELIARLAPRPQERCPHGGSYMSEEQPERAGAWVDYPYRPEDVDPEVRPIFEQLQGEFGTGILSGLSNFGLWQRAEVRNVASRSAVRVRVKTGTHHRPSPLSPQEMGNIRDHLTSGNERILEL
jgi:hypothetical protein